MIYAAGQARSAIRTAPRQARRAAASARILQSWGPLCSWWLDAHATGGAEYSAVAEATNRIAGASITAPGAAPIIASDANGRRWIGFDGVSMNLTVSTTSDPKSLTVCALVAVDAVPGLGFIAERGPAYNTATNGYALSIIATGEARISCYSGAYSVATSSAAYSGGVLVGRVDRALAAGETSLYSDGQPLPYTQTIDGDTGDGADSAVTNIGSRNGGASSAFAGRIAQALVVEAVLSDEQIADLSALIEARA